MLELAGCRTPKLAFKFTAAYIAKCARDGCMADWVIEYWQLPIALVAVHGQLIVRDGSGAIVRSYEGLATSERGQVKPVGYLPSDRIKAYVRAGRPLMRMTEARYPRQILWSGPQDKAMEALHAADAAAAAINAQNLAYPILGVLGRHTNSNAVISALVAAMHIAAPAPGGYAPGHRVALLTGSV